MAQSTTFKQKRILFSLLKRTSLEATIIQKKFSHECFKNILQKPFSEIQKILQQLKHSQLFSILNKQWIYVEVYFTCCLNVCIMFRSTAVLWFHFSPSLLCLIHEVKLSVFFSDIFILLSDNGERVWKKVEALKEFTVFVSKNRVILTLFWKIH